MWQARLVEASHVAAGHVVVRLGVAGSEWYGRVRHGGCDPHSSWVKRRQKLKRYKGLEADLDKLRAWQRRTQEVAAKRAREATAPARTERRKRQRSHARSRNDAAWRAQVMELRGERCRACGSSRHVECDHLIERSQGGPSIPENGLPLCGEFGPCRAHVRKTRNELRIHRDWLDADQIEWLAREGYARWEDDGTVTGRFHKTFAALNPQEGN